MAVWIEPRDLYIETYFDPTSTLGFISNDICWRELWFCTDSMTTSAAALRRVGHNPPQMPGAGRLRTGDEAVSGTTIRSNTR